ncbi:MAG: hypothetical protein MUP22_00700 [Desulfobacterales bacterium]|nr:hypothetical protein [Desulfobacterales bacterium]
MVIVDGLSFDKPVRNIISELKTLADNKKMPIWFTVQTHRHESPISGELPVQLEDISDLFNIIIELHPVGKEIQLKVLKSASKIKKDPELFLDPSTMLVKNK